MLVRADVEEKSLDFVVADNCDPRALEMAKNGELPETKEGKAGGRTAGEKAGRGGRKAGKPGKAGKKAKAGKAAKGDKPGSRKHVDKLADSRNSTGHMGRKKNKDKKHMKRKGKRRSGSSIIAEIDPMQI